MEFISYELFDNYERKWSRLLSGPSDFDYKKYLKEHETDIRALQRQEELEEKERKNKIKQIKLIKENDKRMRNNWIEADRNRDPKIIGEPEKFKDHKRIAAARRWLRQTPPPNFYLLSEKQQLSIIILFGLDNGESQSLEDTAKILGLTCLETGEQSYTGLKRIYGKN